ncbi:uncharacterized protein F4822DRAFT_389793 [Hypoxylon trugodes]|uniref:uncharacterized protein n=1 Tax=Hypoxylon trugodes TaxID=326681 RepID=UPI0021959489|nr:uncharacterized protein F4822DRAFT_389793 [Hypoxylon trugodes]KAI1392159.1 hypothetical protein F4822DRAFT_389793 [Hypoxylon trugodes]
MGCDCRRLTSRYACSHKEREFYRCWRYYYKKKGSCIAILFSDCEIERHAVKVPRVCNSCYEYFVTNFGEVAAHKVSQKFLEYKEYSGVHKDTIDPATIPHEAYVSPKELYKMGAPRAAAALQRATSGMSSSSTSVNRLHPSPPPLSPPAPVIPRSRHGDRVSNPISRSTNPIQRPRSHNRNSRTNLTIDEAARRNVLRNRYLDDGWSTANMAGWQEEEEEDRIDSPRTIESDDMNDDRAVHGKTGDRALYQPEPRRTRPPIHEQPSSSSLVSRITKAAETVKIPGYARPSSIRILAAPKIPTWRREVRFADEVIEKGEKPRRKTPLSAPYVSSVSMASPSLPRSKSVTYLLRTPKSADSLQGSPNRRVSPCSPPVPPPRTPRTSHFREHGIPTPAFLEKENNDSEMTLTPGTPNDVLVSVSLPSPSFSCAVQSCFCKPGETDEAKKCPSCRARRRLERRLQMKWI